MATAIIARIDEEVNKHLLLMSDLCTRRNSFLLVFRLSPETLANIFTLVARDRYEKDCDHYIHDFRIPPWVNVSYVCRHWRAIALSCPALWSYHFVVSPRWTEELLARSQQAALKICIFSDSKRAGFWWSCLLEKLLGHAERIQEFRLHVRDTVLQSKLTLRAPRLEYLEVDAYSDWTPSIDDWDIPPLCTLKLTGCPPPWHSLDVGRLTTLFLCYISPSQQTIVDFLAVLARMQALTWLHLEDALPSARGFLSSNVVPDFPPKFSFPRLSRLLVHAPVSTVVALLSRANIPLEANLRLEFQWEAGSSIVDYAHIAPLIAQRFQSKAQSSFSPTIRSLFLVDEFGSQFSLSMSKHGDNCLHYSHLSMGDLVWEFGIPLAIVVDMDQSVPASDWERIAIDICCAIPLAEVETLETYFPSLSSNFWKHLLSRLPRLRSLQLREGGMPDLASLLALTAKGPPRTLGHITNCDSSPGHAFVPKLEELVLECIVFAPDDELLDDIISERSLRDALST